MTKLECTCTYCDYQWEAEAYGWSSPVCPKCKDKKVKTKPKDKSKSNIFYRDEPLEDAYIKDDDE